MRSNCLWVVFPVLLRCLCFGRGCVEIESPYPSFSDGWPTLNTVEPHVVIHQKNADVALGLCE